MARHDIAAELDQPIDLRVGKIAIAELVAGISDLDADRAGVDIGCALPRRRAGMPGAARFRHELVDAAVLIDEIVAGDTGFLVGEPRDRFFGGLHSGVMQQQDIDARRACVVVRRWNHARGEL